MKILAIETSCDETSVAVINEENFCIDILSNIVFSQIRTHQKWGGVVPNLAKREHQRNLVPVLEAALKKARLINKNKTEGISKFQEAEIEKILERDPELLKHATKFLSTYKKPKVDAIAVTVGPGLEPALWVGVNLARVLGYFWNIRIITVNHVEAHIAANWLSSKKSKGISPAICLVVSGGHTQLILMKNFGEYKILGETRDDAAGECFDKTAKILGLGYPGGPIVAEYAKQAAGKEKIELPRPMIYTKDYDFSFSGLKTAVLYKHQKTKVKNKEYLQEMCKEVQQAIIDVLIYKTIKAAKNFKAKSIILGGGVVANYELRKQLAEKIKKEIPHIAYIVPEIKYCTDNAAMIGLVAAFHPKKVSWKNVDVDANLKI